MADLARLVDPVCRAATELPEVVEALLYGTDVELVLVEDPSGLAQLRRLQMGILEPQPARRRGLRTIALERAQQVSLHEAHFRLVLVRPEPVDDLIVRPPRMEVREEREVSA